MAAAFGAIINKGKPSTTSSHAEREEARMMEALLEQEEGEVGRKMMVSMSMLEEEEEQLYQRLSSKPKVGR